MAQWQTKSNIGIDLYAVDTDQTQALGTIVDAEDTDSSALGSGKFMYVAGSASTAAGSVVVCQPSTGTYVTDLAVANDVGLIGVAISEIVANTYGWVQVQGIATCNVAASFAAGNVCYLTATDGTIDDAVVIGDEIYSSISCSAIDTPSTGKAYVYFNMPFVTNASN